MRITVRNHLFAKDYHEAHQSMLNELNRKGFKIIEGVRLEATREVWGGTRLFPLAYEWEYQAEVRQVEQ